MKPNNIHPLINSILIVLIGIFLIYSLTDKTATIAYVNQERLFLGFNMTKEITEKETQKINRLSKELDSLYTVLRFYENKESEEAIKLQANIVSVNKNLTEIKENISLKLRHDIVQRINIYLSDYCEKHKIDLVIGIDKDGNIGYANNNQDITEEVLTYCNMRYEGN